MDKKEEVEIKLIEAEIRLLDAQTRKETIEADMCEEQIDSIKGEESRRKEIHTMQVAANQRSQKDEVGIPDTH